MQTFNSNHPTFAPECAAAANFLQIHRRLDAGNCRNNATPDPSTSYGNFAAAGRAPIKCGRPQAISPGRVVKKTPGRNRGFLSINILQQLLTDTRPMH